MFIIEETTCIESPMIYLDERTPFRRRKGTAPEIDFDRVGNGTLAHGVFIRRYSNGIFWMKLRLS